MTYDDFRALAQSRRSVRKFAERPISRRDLLGILEAARWAPSNHNRQPWRFMILEDRIKISKLAQQIALEINERLKSLPALASTYASEFTQHATFFATAPVLIVVLHKLPVSFANALLENVRNPELISGEPLSTAMAVQNMLLAAHSLGLGACVLTAPLIAQNAIQRELLTPAGYQTNCFIALGLPAHQPEAPRRKNLEQIAQFLNPEGT